MDCTLEKATHLQASKRSGIEKAMLLIIRRRTLLIEAEGNVVIQEKSIGRLIDRIKFGYTMTWQLGRTPELSNVPFFLDALWQWAA